MTTIEESQLSPWVGLSIVITTYTLASGLILMRAQAGAREPVTATAE